MPRQLEHHGGLIHQSSLGSQHVSIRYTEEPKEAGIAPSAGSKGDSCENVWAETVNGLHKAKLIHHRGRWKTGAAVELATLEWMAWFNARRLHGASSYIPPPKLRQTTIAAKHRVQVKSFPLKQNSLL